MCSHSKRRPLDSGVYNQLGYLTLLMAYVPNQVYHSSIYLNCIPITRICGNGEIFTHRGSLSTIDGDNGGKTKNLKKTLSPGGILSRNFPQIVNKKHRGVTRGGGGKEEVAGKVFHLNNRETHTFPTLYIPLSLGTYRVGTLYWRPNQKKALRLLQVS